MIDVESCCMVNWFYKMEAGVFPARQPKLEGWILDFKSSPFLYVLGFCVVGFIIVQSVFFLVRAWRRGKQLGMTTATLKNTVVSSALFTIAPALAIVATVLTLSKALGLVLPWIRLTVIGAIQYEVPAAEAAINAFGISTGLSQPVTDPEVFAAVAWVMTIGSILPLVIVPFALKKIQKTQPSLLRKPCNRQTPIRDGNMLNWMKKQAQSILTIHIHSLMLAQLQKDMLLKK